MSTSFEKSGPIIATHTNYNTGQPCFCDVTGEREHGAFMDGYNHPAIVREGSQNKHGLPIARCGHCGEIIDSYVGFWLHSARSGAAR